MILAHCYGRDQRYAGDYAGEYLMQGYQVLTPNLCASGQSEGKYITMGVKEGEEIATRHPGAEIVLHGVSMGVDTVLMTVAREDAINVTAVIEDCGYTSAYEMFSQQLGGIFGLPSFPIMEFVDIVSCLKTGARISEASPVEVVDKIKVPVLFIHGSEDKLVPQSMMEDLYKACSVKREKLIVEGAGHGCAMICDRGSYWKMIVGFLNQT